MASGLSSPPITDRKFSQLTGCKADSFSKSRKTATPCTLVERSGDLGQLDFSERPEARSQPPWTAAGGRRRSTNGAESRPSPKPSSRLGSGSELRGVGGGRRTGHGRACAVSARRRWGVYGRRRSDRCGGAAGAELDGGQVEVAAVQDTVEAAAPVPAHVRVAVT